jgi:hypothetical protein
MNRLALITAALLATVSINAFAQFEPSQQPANFSKIYVPVGFDSNDHVQIVGEGIFENGCYRPAPTVVNIDQANKVINLGPVAYKYGGFCAQVILPFERTIDIGVLKIGNWKITQGSDPKVIAEIPVKPALALAPDDFLYAPVEQAFIRQSGTRTMIFMTGEFQNSCMSIEKIDVSTSNNTIVVQPIAQMGATDCKEGKFAFQKAVRLPALSEGRYLLHVRSLNGNAVNNLVNIKADGTAAEQGPKDPIRLPKPAAKK